MVSTCELPEAVLLLPVTGVSFLPQAKASAATAASVMMGRESFIEFLLFAFRSEDADARPAC